ncbi:MAG: FIST signal transduction protein [Bacteroidota bacterium]
MKVLQSIYTEGKGWTDSGDQTTKPQLVLAFAPLELADNQQHYEVMRNRFPGAHLVSVSTSGDIAGTAVLDNSIVVSALEFEKTELKVLEYNVADFPSPFELGKSMFKALNQSDLAHILIISDGLQVNGSELVGGLTLLNEKRIPITGGLAGDNARFLKTVVGLDHFPSTGNVVGIGFYGSSIRVGHGSKGGWDPFGPERVVTRSDRNILYELDDQSALELYKKYLGELSKELPGSALLFPLTMKLADSDEPLVRTILSVDEKEQSMTFAGNIPQGARVQLMKANFDRVIDAASTAATESLATAGTERPDFALLISCVGRKIVLNQRVEDEVEDAVEVLGSDTITAGFYSNGEISPVMTTQGCELHNQTMTITTYREI